MKWDWVQTVIILILVAAWMGFLWFAPGDCFAEAPPTEPPIEEATSWTPHKALGVVICYKAAGICFAHPVFDHHPAPECSQVATAHGLIHLMRLGPIPYRWSVKKEATLWKRPTDAAWKPLIKKTFKAK